MTCPSSTFPGGELVQDALATDLTCAVIPAFAAEKRHSTGKDTTP